MATASPQLLRYAEERCDLFSVPSCYALGHCVAEDLRMSSGIAVVFKNTFNNVDFLRDQNVTTGGVAVLEHSGRHIFYLVTKRRSNGKPTYDSLRRSLIALRSEMIKNHITKLAIPAIGCGLDRLQWPSVRQIIHDIFYSVDVEILVCFW